MWLSFTIPILFRTTAKVVTSKLPPNGRWKKISIHTTAKVVTKSGQPGRQLRSYFNPYHRKGGDPGDHVGFDRVGISIHTTAKVVTLLESFSHYVYFISIHTTAKVVTTRGAILNWKN